MIEKGITASQSKKLVTLTPQNEKRYLLPSVTSRVSGQASAVSGGSASSAGTQSKEAALVAKLPADFPIDQWDTMSTKAQQAAMQNSGLNKQEQWTLLNATTPLETQSLLNNIQKGLATRSLSAQEAALLTNAAKQITAEKNNLASGNASILPSLQKALLRGELENRWSDLKAVVEKNTVETATVNKSTASAAQPASTQASASKADNILPGALDALRTWVAGLFSTKDTESAAAQKAEPTTTPKATPSPTPTPAPTPVPTSKTDKTSTNLWDALRTWVAGLFSKKETESATTQTPEPTATEEIDKIILFNPTPTPTPMPTPSPKPTATPVPTPSEREVLASEGVKFVETMVDTPYSNSGRYGAKGYDCSGLVIEMCKAIRSKLPFDGVHIKTTCKYGMSRSFLANPEYGTPIYKYKEGGTIDGLQAGDLIFSANPDNLEQDAHVSIATGEMIYDSKTGQYYPQVVEASSVAGKVTDVYPAYNETNNKGLYVRSHTDQVITYVIRPNYDWEEQP